MLTLALLHGLLGLSQLHFHELDLLLINSALLLRLRLHRLQLFTQLPTLLFQLVNLILHLFLLLLCLLLRLLHSTLPRLLDPRGLAPRFLQIGLCLG